MSLNNKNILLVIAGLGNGGAENQIVKLWELLNSNSYNCYLLILNKKQKVDIKFSYIINNDKFLSLELSNKDRFLFFKIIKGLARIYKTKNITTIISFLHIANIFTRMSKIICPKIKIITSIRSDFSVQYNRRNKLIEYILSPMSSSILSNSKATVTYLQKKWFIGQKVVYLPNIIDCEHKDHSFFNKNKQEPYTIVSVGRLSEEKNYDFLLQVAKELLGMDVKFVIVGDGSQRKNIESKIQEFKLDNVVLAGLVLDVNLYFKDANLFFMPSFFEGISNAMIEAICNMVPVLVSSGANTSKIIEDGHDGFEFNEYNPKKVTDMILGIRRLSNEVIDDMCDRAKSKVVKEMGSENVLRILGQVL